MPPFKRKDEAEKQKPDRQGEVVVKIFLRDPKSQVGYALPGNVKREIVIPETTVGKVYAAIETALFGDEKEE